jgi:hypothetical protein
MRDLCVRRRCEELLDCAALVGLNVREGDPPQLPSSTLLGVSLPLIRLVA